MDTIDIIFTVFLVASLMPLVSMVLSRTLIIEETNNSITCNHEYSPYGWTTAKCDKCGRKTKDPNKIQEAFELKDKIKAEALRKHGWSEEEIIKDKQDLYSGREHYFKGEMTKH